MDLFGDLPEPSCKLQSQTPNNITATETAAENRTETCVKRKHESDCIGDDGENPVSCTSKKLTTGLHKLKGYHAEIKGEREDMQDAYAIKDDFLAEINNKDPSLNRVAYYGVFDGHAGARASKYASEHLHKTLANKFPKGDIGRIDTDIKKCLVETFKQTDEDFLKEASKGKPSWKDGSTACTVLAVNDTLFIANLGDSKAILCRYNDNTNKYSALPLSKDHNPEMYDERMRIQKAGGYVRDGRVMGVLEVSRSIGDGSYKKHGVSCLPDIKKCQLTPQDKYLLIACDGLWKTFDSDASIAYINDILQDTTIEGTEFKSQEDVRWETACVRLASEAVRRLSADNVTVLIVSINTNR